MGTTFPRIEPASGFSGFAYSRHLDPGITPNFWRHHCCSFALVEAAMIESFRDLKVWNKAMELAVRVYTTTERLPASERFGLTSQIRRSAVSIPSNIAEGKATGGQRYRRHLKIALGSEAELHTQIELARRLKMLTDVEANGVLEDLSEVGRMVTALLKALPRT